MNVSEENIPLQTMLEIARSQPDYNLAAPIIEVILTHYINSPHAKEVIQLVNEVKASFRVKTINYNTAPTSKRNMPRSGGGRPKRAGIPLKKAFIYDGIEKNKRLMMLFVALKELNWIANDTNPQVFLDTFSGEEIRQRIIWTGGINTIAELFRRLVIERQIVKLPEKHSIWVMVDGLFCNGKRGQFFGNNRLRNTHAPLKDNQAITYLVNILDTNFSERDLKEMLESQR